MKLINIVGARPNFMKMAPIVRQLERHPEIAWQLIHTGQHYDDAMSRVFFEELQLPPPHVFLGVGSGSQAEQTAQMMVKLERAMQSYCPDMVLVVGDTNSALAGALTAAKLCIPVAHVEAGLRSYDRTMPEEINRLCTDCISTLFFTPSRGAGEILRREGVPADRIHFVGNVMIDTLMACRERAMQSQILETLQLEEKNYAVLTLHRPSNVDTPSTLAWLLEVIGEIAGRIPVVFPIHPRTQRRIEEFGLQPRVGTMPQVKITAPLGYLDFLKLMACAKFVMTDSGGIQEETTVLGVPCLTLRENTERPETVTEGTNVLVGRDRDKILAEACRILDGHGKVGRVPERWDGKAAERIVDVLLRWSSNPSGG
ncbi:MAG: UDP-N-acetylglucosamine 2-epimerase (non-hydrolyzing) [Abditibacteriales bacterium]|nr:UDP-N-acetylglucosamine 2-epimerase (non-hydrolyzing) [Abditibacteriales bacterium]MDW8367440.1 UDP-N-acetylglucosamine 2-epimerase (non-hydrolyzing) [Abditibacteriales bacterium]